MISTATLVTYVTVVLGLFLIPGPAVLLVLGRAMAGGRRVGMATGLGVAFGDLLHTLMATIGLSAVLMTSALAFSAVKYVGAAYLIYLGIRAVMEKPAMDQPAAAALPAAAPIAPGKAFLQAIPAELLNPKTALFFLAFMPQFVHPERGSTFAQFAVLGLIFVALSSLYSTLLALSIRPLGRLIGRLAWLKRWQGKIVGTIFIALGLKVAAQQR